MPNGKFELLLWKSVLDPSSCLWEREIFTLHRAGNSDRREERGMSFTNPTSRCFVGNAQDLGVRKTCPERAATAPPRWVGSGQPKPGAAPALGTVLAHPPPHLRSISLEMFTNTQSRGWVTATCCPSPSPVFITTGAVVKAAIAQCGARGSVLNSFIKEKHKQTTPW